MSVYICNSLSRKKEKLQTLKEKEVKIYSCGPTVYNYAHIGNFRSYICADLLQRFLRFKGYKVKWVMNITDIDDKTISGSQKKFGDLKPLKALKEFTKEYEKVFFEDLETLNIKREDFLENPRATDFIDEMQNLIRKIYKNGFAYEKQGSIYFDVKKFAKNHKYGNLKNIDFEHFRPTRIDEDDGKESVADFVLWKGKKENEPFWDFAIDGMNLPGRPGWHIECSAMSHKIFGGKIDIHSGGIDLQFPHHENEIAQSQAGYGHGIANNWFHNEYLIVEGEKMSKSLGNFFTLRDLIKKGFSPNSIRFALLSSHYRSKLNFTEKAIKEAEKNLKTINNLYQIALESLSSKEKGGIKNLDSICKKAIEAFEISLEDDLNISKALSFLFGYITQINSLIDKSGTLSKSDAEKIRNTLEKFNEVLNILEEKKEIPKDVIKIAEERERYRKEKNWEMSDKLREEILNLGFVVEDKQDGFRLHKK